jgi:protein NEDD1
LPSTDVSDSIRIASPDFSFKLLSFLQAIVSLNWQRSNPIVVIEATCTKEAALLGTTGEESAIMPDPLPASGLGSRGRPTSTSLPMKASSGRYPQLAQDSVPGPLPGASAGAPTTRQEGSGFSSNHLSMNGSISRLQTPHDSYGEQDDMEVFSPLVDVQPITPSLSSFYESSNEKSGGDGSASVTWSQSNIRKFPNMEDAKDDARMSLERRLSSRSQVF